MIVVEILPITTLLTVLTQEILETAIAACDVLMEKDTFKSLSANLRGICPVLEEFRSRNIGDSIVTLQALEYLQQDVRRARNLVEMCKNKSRFYQLVHCRNIIKQAQQVTRDFGVSLARLSLASTEVSLDIQYNVDKIRDQMIHAEYRASEQKLEILERIEMGIKQHTTDQVFINDLIRGIAGAVGVPVEDCLEMRKELAQFRKEKEEAAERKQKAEEAFMEQVITLLSRADATRTPEMIREDYRMMKQEINVDEELPPFETFRCLLSRQVMRDPVSVATGQTYERANIEEWFASGRNTDPITGVELLDLSLRPNHKIRECIEEWLERNYCIRIQNIRRKLESGNEGQVKQALDDLRELCSVSYKIPHWVAEEQFVVAIMETLKSRDKDIKQSSLMTLRAVLVDSDDNKNQVVDYGGVELAVQYLASDIGISKQAVLLLLDLVQSGSSPGSCVCPMVLEKLGNKGEGILSLVTLHNMADEDGDTALYAGQILELLCDKDKNVVEMAKANWFTPLIERLNKGLEDSKLEMAKALGDIEPAYQSLHMVGDEGAIGPLVHMLAGNLDHKGAALRALKNLVSCRSNNKRRLAEEGAVPILLDHLFSEQYPALVRELAAVILDKLLLTDGTLWLVDAKGNALDLEKIIQKLLVLQDSLANTSQLQRHTLFALHGLMSSPLARRDFKVAGGISTLLHLLEHRVSDIRDAAVQVLSRLAGDNAQEIGLFMADRRLVGLLVRLLNHSSAELQEAAVRLLACLPREDPAITQELLEEDALPALMQIIDGGNQTLKENIVGVLLPFTSPADIELQKRLISMGIYKALRGLIYSGTQFGKLQAAMAFRNFSVSTWKLSSPSALPGRCCYFMLRKPAAVCRVHCGLCGERTTFCLVEAQVVDDLVQVIKEGESDAAIAAVEALSTLVMEDETPDKGALLLHEKEAIGPIIKLILHGTDRSKGIALDLLKKVFRVRKLAGYYGGKARMQLADLATHGRGRQASEVLALLDHLGSSSIFL